MIERFDRSTFHPLGWSWRGEFHYFQEHTMMDRRILDGSLTEWGNRIMVVTSKDPEVERAAIDKVARNYLATKKRSFPGYMGGFEIVVQEEPLRRYRAYGWVAYVPTKDVVKPKPRDVNLCGCVDPFAAGVIHSDTGPCVAECRCSLCAAKR